MPTLEEVLASDIIYSERSDGSHIIATFIPVEGADREHARWDLRVTDKQGHSMKDELITVTGSDSAMYRKLYSLDELKELAQDRGYVEWLEGYPSKPHSTPPSPSPSETTEPASPLASPKENGTLSEAERRKETERIVQKSLSELAKAKPGDIQQITVAQLNIDREYCQEALQQGQKSFQLAAKFAPWGIVFIAISTLLLMFLTFFMTGGNIQAGVALLSAFNSILIEGIPAVGFYMYAQASKQFGTFSERLDRRNRYLIANGIISTSLEGSEKQQAFLALIHHILSSTEPDLQSLLTLASTAESNKSTPQKP